MNEAFSVWMSKVNRLVEAKFFLGCDDLPDMPYDDWFEDGMSPKEALELMIEELESEGWSE